MISSRLNIETSTADKFLESFAGIVEEGCRDLSRVALPSLGSFTGEKQDEKVVKDLASGKRILLPPAIEIVFTAGGRLKNSISEGLRK